MRDTSERELLISKVLHTLQENCLESSKVWVGELNEASGFRVRLDGERMSNIPHEAVSNILQLPSSDGVLGGNEFMTFNTTSNQAGETHEPLEQDVQEQSAIAAPSLNYENASLIVDGGLQSTNKRRKISSLWDKFDKHWGENGEVGATFKHCKKMYRAESKRGTSNLHKHLRKCLPSREDEAEQQPLILETDGSSTSVIQRNSVINQERSRLDIETMIINHGYPYTSLNFIQKTTLKPMTLLFSDKRRRNSSNILTVSLVS